MSRFDCEFRMRSSLLASVLSLIALGLPPAAQSGESFVHRFQPGDRFVYELTTEIDQEASVVGGTKVIKDNSIQRMTVETSIHETDDSGTVEVRQKITRIRMEMDLPAPAKGRIEFDTNSPTETSDGPLKRLMQMVGQEWSIQVDTQGKISNLKPRRKQADPKAPPPPPGSAGLREEGMREISSQFFPPLSDSAVDAGSEWQRKLASKTQFGSLRTKQKFTYDGSANGGLHKFLVVEEYDPKVEVNAPLQVEMPTGNGEFWFDAEKGRAVKGKNSQIRSMTIDMGEQGKMKQKIKSNRSFRLVESASELPQAE